VRVALVFVLLACKDEKALVDHAKEQQTKIEPVDMNTWMPKDADKAWQGPWLLHLVDEGPLVGVNVAGDQATIFDGKQETQVAFKIIEPCAVAIGTHELQFLIRDNTVVIGRGAAGMRTGEKAIVCGDGRDPDAPEEGVYLVTKNRCTTHKRDAQGVWGYRNGVCVWANARGDDLLDVGTEHYSSTVIVKGDFLEERNFTASAKDNRRATSWEAAKTMVTANMKPPTKLEEALAAGGKVGDTSTIAGIHATYANSPTPLVGMELEVTGVLVETSTQSIRGKVASTLAVIADPNVSEKSMQLVCKTQGTVTGIKPGDRVVVKGDIDTGHDYARLKRCRITKAP
jgi:hypothetical protein